MPGVNAQKALFALTAAGSRLAFTGVSMLQQLDQGHGFE